MDEVVDVVKNIQNMTLVHEIALNPEFKLKPYEPPEDRYSSVKLKENVCLKLIKYSNCC